MFQACTWVPCTWAPSRVPVGGCERVEGLVGTMLMVSLVGGLISPIVSPPFGMGHGPKIPSSSIIESIRNSAGTLLPEVPDATAYWQ